MSLVTCALSLDSRNACEIEWDPNPPQVEDHGVELGMEDAPNPYMTPIPRELQMRESKNLILR